jgi:cellulose synthase/poly-beta-1,6-N-acetylglucosamine synthase-like glycosyltransferase
VLLRTLLTCRTGSAITEAMWHFCVFLNKKHFARPVLYLEGKDVPPVVMVIVTCGEPLDIIMDTVRAALHVDYPHDKLRIVIADDGNAASLKDQVLLLQANHPHLHYTSRSGGKGYKAGNLNNCLRAFVPTLNFEYNWICVLDADMMPEPQILRALLPHATACKGVGMVTTGQVSHWYRGSLWLF